MQSRDIINTVHNYYWEKDLNCATTMLNIMAQEFKINLDKQVINSAIGMHGAGKYRAQCGLVEGALMFIGIYGIERNLSGNEIVNACYDYAAKFENKFGSLVCRDLRPEGFKSNNPPHLCEDLTVEAVRFSIDFVMKI